jgi:hypothetical protein
VSYWSLNRIYGGEVDPIEGQQLYGSPGLYDFVVPAGVFSVCIACIGSGAPGGTGGTSTTDGYGGSGGALAYRNTITTTPGETLTVRVGESSTGSGDSRDSWVKRGSTLLVGAGGGLQGVDKNMFNPGEVVNFYGGHGGASDYGASIFGGSPETLYAGGGGGSAGGWSSAGVSGGVGPKFFVDGTSGSTGSGGSGGSGSGAGMVYQADGMGGANFGTKYGGAGGGTGIVVSGSNGAAGTYSSVFDDGVSGGGGSSGQNGGASNPKVGGAYGGGGGGGIAYYNDTTTSMIFDVGGVGGSGAVRIIWGDGRSYPSNSTDV